MEKDRAAQSPEIVSFDEWKMTIEPVCVKCGKPQDLKTVELLIRCPYCKDFFKPLAKLIFLHEEELNRLVALRPGKFFFDHPFTKRILFVLLLLLVLLSSYWLRIIGIAGILALLAFNRYMLRHITTQKIQELEKSIEELNREYQRLYPEVESEL